MAASIVWTPEKVNELREARALGLKEHEIALLLDVSVAGVRAATCRHLTTPPRKVPVTTDTPPARPVRDRKPLPVGACIEDLASIAGMAPPPHINAVLIGPATTCQWPMTDRRPWRFCEAPAMAGRNFCAGHYHNAYVRKSRADMGMPITSTLRAA